jgi:SPP1 gp7 family putative phage head morphogenesis protein
MSANTYLIGALTRHQVLIQRLANGDARKILPALAVMRREILAALAGQDLTSFQTARLSVLMAEITAITNRAAGNMAAVAIPNMQDFGVYESQFTQRLLAGAVTVELAGVNAAALRANVLSAPMKLVSGKTTVRTTIPGMFDIFASGVAREVETLVLDGITAGSTNQQITSAVNSMVGTRSKAQAQTVVRTATNQVGSLARSETYRQNADVLQGEEWVATLDSNTRVEHAVLDGNKYTIGAGPQPPLGYNCRCVRVPVVDPAFAALREGATRASTTGPVSATKTFGGFFKDQGADFQREFLGPERYDLYKSGQVKFDGFADQSGRAYTLDELAAREGLALN